MKTPAGRYRPTPRFASRYPALLAPLLALAGCESIGDGSRIEKLEILPVDSRSQTVLWESGRTYKLFQCLRDELLVIGTFSNGTTANFNSRARWSSSDPGKVQVSNGDIDSTLLIGGSFQAFPTVKYVSGTVIPVALTDDNATPTDPDDDETVTISAEFVGKVATLDVVVRKPRFTVVRAPDSDPLGFAQTGDPVPVGEGTQQRLTLFGDFDGRLLPARDFAGSRVNGIGINPFRWVFTGGVFEARDSAVTSDFDKWVVPSLGSRSALLNVATGVVTGVAADSSEYALEVQTSLCADSLDADLRPVADVRVADFDAAAPLALAHEPGFNGNGFNPGDLVLGTSEQLMLTAQLDFADGGGSPDAFQALDAQVRYDFEPKTQLCDSLGLNCLANEDFLLGGRISLLTTSLASDGGTGDVSACFPLCAATLASLTADVTSGAAPLTVNFSGVGFNGTDVPVITAQTCAFDFGDPDSPDNTATGPCADPVQHVYQNPGDYTATVRITDSNGAKSPGKGALRIHAGDPPAGNTPPVAGLTLTPATGAAPLPVLLDAAGASDPDTGDTITVYEFDLGNGDIVRQSGRSLTYVYKTQPAAQPSVVVYDSFGTPSARVTATSLAVTGTSVPLLRSNVLSFNAVPATLCSTEITPGTASEQSFTEPAGRFEAVGTFFAAIDGDDDCTTGSAIGTQRITRFVDWAARPADDDTVFSDLLFLISGGLRGIGDFTVPGQIVHSQNTGAPADVSIEAEPTAPFADAEPATPVTLTVTPCPAATCRP